VSTPVIVCIEDQRDVLAALLRDLEPLAAHCELIDCENAGDAMEIFDELAAHGRDLAMVISDHIMPGKSGVDLLARLHRDARFPHTRKVLLTGLATHQDTIRAINEAGIDRYIEKPWRSEDLLKTVKVLLTHFVFDAGWSTEAHREILDPPTLLELTSQRAADNW